MEGSGVLRRAGGWLLAVAPGGTAAILAMSWFWPTAADGRQRHDADRSAPPSVLAAEVGALPSAAPTTSAPAPTSTSLATPTVPVPPTTAPPPPPETTLPPPPPEPVAAAGVPGAPCVSASIGAVMPYWELLPSPGYEAFSISIPKIGVDESVREGVAPAIIDAGIGHWPGTPGPGGYGNVVVGGHRTTHSAPFQRASELVPGDDVVLTDGSGSYPYMVTGLEVVPDTALDIVGPVEGCALTMFTCHPPGSATQRLVVHAELRT